MKRTYIYIAMLLSYAVSNAQTVDVDGLNTINLNSIDTLYGNGENQTMRLTYPIGSVKRITFKKEDTPKLDKADKATSGNELKRVYFTPQANNSLVLETVEAVKDGNTFSVFIPYLTDFSNLKASFVSSGSVYVDGAIQKSGVSSNSFVNEITYKVVSGEGDVQTYKVKVYNSNLPVLNVNTVGEVPLKVWTGDVPASLASADNEKVTDFNTQVKAKGSRYSLLNKRSLNLKTDSKVDLLDMGKSKRWVLLSNKQDASLLRTHVGLAVARTLDGMAWVPNEKPVELILGGKHMGTYFVCEQVRIDKDRLNGSSVWSFSSSAEVGDVAFSTKHSNTTCVLEDAAEDLTAEQAADAFSLINKFEDALYADNFTDANKGYRQLIDVNSFVDWLIANEVMKSSDAANSGNFYIDNNAKIAMGPVGYAEDFAGNNGQSAEGFAVCHSGWMERLMQDPYFASLVAERFASVKSDIKAEANSVITNGFDELKLSNNANEALWNVFGKGEDSFAQRESAYSEATDELAKWIEKRLLWLEQALTAEAKLAKVNTPTAQNEIKSFKLSKQKNGSALLSDYTATITGDSIKIFVPYLVQFDLVPEFEAASGATVYAESAEQSSGSSKVNFLNPVAYKVVAQNGDVRTYKVCIYNSGIPVIYINTPNGSAINSKETWVTNTELNVYLKDGYLDYTSGDLKANVKGRGNSTWDATTEKRPYAVKLNKKAKILGMMEHKRWVLMANYYDATFFRNELANYLAKKCTNQQWSPSGYNVELVLNGAHKGNYYFCEQVRVSDVRCEGDYLVEADRKANAGQIKGVQTGNYFNVKDPDVDNNSQELQYVKGVLDNFENTLYGSNFLDADKGYKKLADMESFVDWYFIKELSKDYDGNMFTSCYCHIMEDGTIKMGPIWDFDLAFGGNPFEKMMGGFGGTDYAWYNEPDGYHIADADWFVQMWKDPEFVALLRKRVDAMLDDIDDIMDYIDENTKLLTLSASANKVGFSGSSGGMGGFGGWGGWGGGNTTTETKKTYAEEMQVIKDFVKSRLLWMQQDLKNK